MTSESDSIDAALEQLQHAIRAGLRAEQLLDRLTRLPNDEALTEWLEEKVENQAMVSGLPSLKSTASRA